MDISVFSLVHLGNIISGKEIEPIFKLLMSKNEFEPIFKLRKLGKSFIKNDSIEPKLSSPISNDSNNVNRDISNIV